MNLLSGTTEESQTIEGDHMKSKTEYYPNSETIKSITYYLGGKEFDQIFFDENGEFESHIMLYDFGISEPSVLI